MDIAHLTSHLKTLLTSTNTDGPIYVDVPGSNIVGSRSGGPRGSRTAKSIVNFLSGGTSGVRRTALDLALSTKKTDYDTVVSLLNSTSGRTVHSLKDELEKMRMVKSEAEIKLMHKAAEISSNAHAKVIFHFLPLYSSGRAEC
jgi:intermediate cleaving peptidase 55